VAGGRLDLSAGSARPFGKLAEALAPIECLLDGVVTRLGDVDALLLFDVLWLDGRLVTDLPYVSRRELLDALDIAGPLWQVPPYFTGGGRFALDAAKEQGLPGVVAKRLDSAYGDGWRRVKGRSPA
jgi:bifunctional non-homologous end joining protein LigD